MTDFVVEVFRLPCLLNARMKTGNAAARQSVD